MPSQSLTKFAFSPVWFRAFKYTIYCLLAYNVWLFFLDDFAASTEMFTQGVTWRNVVEAYSATVDTFAWVILLLLFELETAVIPDEKLSGALKWLLSGIRAVCYFFITYSLYGYIVKLGLVTDLVPFVTDNVCALIGTDFTYVQTLDEYHPITAEVCAAWQGQPLMQIAGTQIVGDAQQVALARSLAWTDVINASTWLIVVAVLELEVWLQLKSKLTSATLRIAAILKPILYLTLLGCAVYWGIDGDFLDFWDAFLWLVAFVFIELNIFEWHAETTAAADAAAQAAT